MLRDTLLRGVAAGLALAGSIALAGCVPGGVTPDGKHVFFETDSQFSNQDTDHNQDVYERSGGKTTLVSIGQGDRGNEADDAQFVGVSSDGSKAFFTTAEEMTGSDNDGGFRDVYRRSGGTTTLISEGDQQGTAADVSFEGVSQDGDEVVFGTTEALDGDDADSSQYDLYLRRGSHTRWVSLGGAGAFPVQFHALVDGSVYFTTDEGLLGQDEDADARDIYVWRPGGKLKLLSTGPEDGPAVSDPMQFRDVSADTRRMFFHTDAALVSEDDDGGTGDVYERKGGNTRLVSKSPGGFDIEFSGSSLDARTVFLQTTGELTGEDDDTDRLDVYSLRGDELTLITQGPVTENTAFDAFLAGTSPDGDRVVFTTGEKLTNSDADSGNNDVYLREGDKTRLLSTGPASSGESIGADFTGLSTNASRVFFVTDEALTNDDHDSALDLYVREGSKTARVSRGKGGTGNGDFDADFAFASRSGTRVFFFTGEALLPADEQPSGDCNEPEDPACSGYERFRNKTKLVTRGN